MGFWSVLFGLEQSRRRALPRRKEPDEPFRQPLLAVGRETYPRPVAGEAHYQEALEAICGPRTEGGYEEYEAAVLEPEPDNPHDSNAVRVMIAGRQVGYLMREDAPKYLARLERLGVSGGAVRCNAVIRGGWYRSRSDQGQFGVSLDLPFPVQLRRVKA